MQVKQKQKSSVGSQQEIRMPHSQISTPKFSKSQTLIQLFPKGTHSIHSKASYPGGKAPLPFKSIHRSQFSMATQSDLSDHPSVLDECIRQTKEIQYHKSVKRTQNYQQINDSTVEKMKTIDNIMNKLLQFCNEKNSKLDNQFKITLLMKQFIEEKQSKQEARQSGENLAKQLADQIEQLKQRISLYEN